jgi:hypothetical protein
VPLDLLEKHFTPSDTAKEESILARLARVSIRAASAVAAAYLLVSGLQSLLRGKQKVQEVTGDESDSDEPQQ